MDSGLWMVVCRRTFGKVEEAQGGGDNDEDEDEKKKKQQEGAVNAPYCVP